MDYKLNDVIDFGDNKYQVINIIKNSNNLYLYLINDDEFKNDVALVKVIDNNGIPTYEPIENDEEFNYVISKLFVDMQGDIKDIYSED